jgi:hypothetical protein
MKKLYLICFFTLFSLDLLQANNSDSTTLKIDKIIEYEHHKYVYNSIKDLDYFYEIKMTVLNKDVDITNYLDFEYDDFIKIEDIEGEVYDQSGKKTKAFRNKDITDVVAYDGSTIADDARKKIINFENNVYPFTLHLKIKYKYKTLFYPISDSYYNGKNSFTKLYTISYDLPDNIDYNITIKNTNDNFTEKKVANRIVKEFRKENLGPFKHEVLEKSFDQIFPYIYLTFSTIEYGEYKSVINNWRDYGDFIYKLNNGRDILPLTEIKKVEEIIANISDTKEKIQKLYEYMQSKTRYISIQLGIGGHQPAPAVDVSNLGYGDCKGLSNYMYSLLKVAGIKSNYIVILAGPEYQGKTYNEGLLPKFNHAILAVPLEQDTIWLECTSQTTPMNYMGDFTGNRQALWIEEGNSRIVNTPRYTAKDNLVIYNATVDIDEKGNCKIACKNSYNNVPGEILFSVVNTFNTEKLDDYFNRKFDIPSYTIEQKSIDLKKSAHPQVNENLLINAPYYASVQGKRLFVVPNILSKSGRKLEQDSNRINDFYLFNDIEEVDTIVLNIPLGYKIESMPKDISLVKPFGEYRISYKLIDNKVVYIRNRIQYRNSFPAHMFNEYVKDLNTIFNSDRSKMVFVKT